MFGVESNALGGIAGGVSLRRIFLVMFAFSGAFSGPMIEVPVRRVRRKRLEFKVPIDREFRDPVVAAHPLSQLVRWRIWRRRVADRTGRLPDALYLDPRSRYAHAIARTATRGDAELAEYRNRRPRAELAAVAATSLRSLFSFWSCVSFCRPWPLLRPTVRQPAQWSPPPDQNPSVKSHSSSCV